jgi:hypothetical protein
VDGVPRDDSQILGKRSIYKRQTRNNVSSKQYPNASTPSRNKVASVNASITRGPPARLTLTGHLIPKKTNHIFLFPDETESEKSKKNLSHVLAVNSNPLFPALKRAANSKCNKPSLSSTVPWVFAHRTARIYSRISKPVRHVSFFILVPVRSDARDHWRPHGFVRIYKRTITRTLIVKGSRIPDDRSRNFYFSRARRRDR